MSSSLRQVFVSRNFELRPLFYFFSVPPPDKCVTWPFLKSRSGRRAAAHTCPAKSQNTFGPVGIPQTPGNKKKQTIGETTSFIEFSEVTCSDSVSHNWVQVLSIPVLLLACNRDWTGKLRMISLFMDPTPLTVTLCVLLEGSAWILGA